MKRVVLLLSFVALCLTAFCDAPPEPGAIIYKGKRLTLHGNLISGYFSTLHQLPKPEIVTIDRRGDTVRQEGWWQGYISVMKIGDDGILYLEDMETYQRDGPYNFVNKPLKAHNADNPYSIKGYFFPGKGAIPQDWFTGLLLITYGDRITSGRYGMMGTYSNYIVMEISQGMIGRVFDMTLDEYNEFCTKQFEAFKQTKDYKTAFDEVSKYYNSSDSLKKERLIKYTLLGRLKKVLPTD